MVRVVSSSLGAPLRHGPCLCLPASAKPHANVRGLGPGMPAPSPRVTRVQPNPVIRGSANPSPTRPRRNGASSVVRLGSVFSVLGGGYKQITMWSLLPGDRGVQELSSKVRVFVNLLPACWRLKPYSITLVEGHIG
jgi:hypothetical protein